MKVCMVSYSFYEGDNRVRRYAESLARRGDEVHAIVLQRGQTPAFEVTRGVRVHRLQLRLRNEKSRLDYLWRILCFMLRSSVFLARSQWRRPFDVIHVHSVPDFLVFAAILPKLLGASVILDIHDILPELYAGKFSGGKPSLLFRALLLVERWSCAFVDHVVIANDLWRERLLQRSVAEKKCTTVMNYPDPAIFRRFREKQSNGRFVMLYPGSLSWHQGVDIAVRAMVRITRERPQVDLHVYGVGPEEPALRQLIHELGLSSHVFFPPPLLLDDVPLKMIDADLGIVPKRADGFGNEAFSTKIFEFMTLGVPVLVSATKVDCYYFDEEEVAFFESGNVDHFATRVIELVDDPEWRRRLSQSGLRVAESNSWGTKQQEYWDLIRDLRRRRAGRMASAQAVEAPKVS